MDIKAFLMAVVWGFVGGAAGAFMSELAKRWYWSRHPAVDVLKLSKAGRARQENNNENKLR